jgi:putative colanic acid biosynthesis acetyltransferase WcaF
MLDIRANLRAKKWGRRELAIRFVWTTIYPLFAYSPRQAWGWRRFLLRLFGARIGANVQIYPTVQIVIPWNLEISDETGIGDRAILYALGPIKIGSCVTISQNAHLCGGTHDYRLADLPLIKSPIWVDDGAWICADAFVGPGVRIGKMAILGARGVAMKDIPDHMIAVGNPATIIRRRPDLITVDNALS